VPVG
ncbi:hypothetical protein D027_2269B, partial [Vibrio parahaemolyticus 861]